MAAVDSPPSPDARPRTYPSHRPGRLRIGQAVALHEIRTNRPLGLGLFVRSATVYCWLDADAHLCTTSQPEDEPVGTLWHRAETSGASEVPPNTNVFCAVVPLFRVNGDGQDRYYYGTQVWWRPERLSERAQCLPRIRTYQGRTWAATDVATMFDQGLRTGEIAHALNVTRQRIHQVITTIREVREGDDIAANKALLNECQRRIIAHAAENGSVTTCWCMATLDLSRDIARRNLACLVRWGLLVRAGLEQPHLRTCSIPYPGRPAIKYVPRPEG